MAVPDSSFSSEDSIDLRKIMETLLRRWRIIVGIVALAALTGIGFSFLFQPAIYQSSGSARLTVISPDTGLGLTPQGYLALASGDAVMDSVRKQIDLPVSSDQLRNGFSFDLPQDDTITFTASANTAEQSFLLAETWLEAYQRELDDLLEVQFSEAKAQALQEIENLTHRMTSAEEELARFDLKNDQSLLALKLSALEERLTHRETRLRELLAISLPMNEARLASGQNLFGLITGNIGGGGVPESGEAAEISPPTLVPSNSLAFKLDPAYMELRQNLTSSQLTALERDLVNTDIRLRELNHFSIPNTRARLRSLEKILAGEPEFLSQAGSSVELVPNPVYLSLSQDLAESTVQLDVKLSEATALANQVVLVQEHIDDLRMELLFSREIEKIRSTLAIERKEAKVLETTILELRPEIRRLRERVRIENADRQELDSAVTDLRAAYDLARSELDQLVNLEGKLTSFSRLSVEQQPAKPANPVSSQRPRTIALAMFLGLVIGGCAALLADYYRNRLSNSPNSVRG